MKFQEDNGNVFTNVKDMYEFLKDKTKASFDGKFLILSISGEYSATAYLDSGKIKMYLLLINKRLHIASISASKIKITTTDPSITFSDSTDGSINLELF